MAAQVSVYIYISGEQEYAAAFLAVRMDKGGCEVASATGVFLWFDPSVSHDKLL